MLKTKSTNRAPLTNAELTNQNDRRHVCKLILLVLCLCVALPALAADAAPKEAKPFDLMSTFIYNGLPWGVGVLADVAIYFKSLSKGKNFQTALTGLVLSFGGIWFTWIGVGGAQLFQMEAGLLWAIAVALCIIVLSICKAIAYWVINEKFPPKQTMLLYLASAAAMTIASFVAMQLFAPHAAKTPG